MTNCFANLARSLPGAMNSRCPPWRITSAKSLHPRAAAVHQRQPRRSQRLHRGHKAGLLLLVAALAAQSADIDAAYRATTAKFRADLLAERKEQWYPLAGLFWLHPGTNSFGSGAQNDVVLPKGSARERAGSFTLAN